MREVVLGILVAALVGCAAPTGPSSAGAAAGPRFAADGPNAEEYGSRAGYPVKVISRAPFFVGAFSGTTGIASPRSRWPRRSPRC